MRGKAKVECDGRHWDGNVAAMEEAGQGSYYLQDDLGSPMHLLDGCGEIRESYGFDEFVQFLFPKLQGRMGGVLYQEIENEIGKPNGGMGSGLVRPYYQVGDQYVVMDFTLNEEGNYDRLSGMSLYTKEKYVDDIPFK